VTQSTALTAALLLFAGGAQAAPVADPLLALPVYTPPPAISGVIRTAGSDLNGLLPLWEADFAKLEPGIRFENHLLSGDNAIGALEAGAADVAVNGREPVLTEFLSFAEVFGNDGPFQVTVATGSAEKLGRTWAEVIYVNKDNPIAHLTMAQLEGIFGAERTGGYQGYKWTSRLARGPESNIRTWGQLGLTGAWADKPIHTYGYAPTGMSNFFELRVFHGGTKWDANYRQYVEATAKQATDRAGTTDQMMADLEADPYGIAWAGLAHGAGKTGLKVIALGESDTGPFVAPSGQTVADRTYPLTRSIFMQMNRPPGTPLPPALKAFLRYVLSRQGQSVVRGQGEYLPLTPDELRRQLDALD
jgi:phosphate transport system substrate-binding protein